MILPLAVLAGGCTAPQTRTKVAVGEPLSRPINEQAMAATYRYLFANNASSLRTAAATYCVGIGRMPDPLDPSATLLAAIDEATPKAAAASTCRMGPQVADAQGRPALFFHLEEVECSTVDDCLFEGGYYEANLSASQGRYRARRTHGTWQVTPEGPQAVS